MPLCQDTVNFKIWDKTNIYINDSII